jgi:hypothetical protein
MVARGFVNGKTQNNLINTFSYILRTFYLDYTFPYEYPKKKFIY